MEKQNCADRVVARLNEMQAGGHCMAFKLDWQSAGNMIAWTQMGARQRELRPKILGPLRSFVDALIEWMSLGDAEVARVWQLGYNANGHCFSPTEERAMQDGLRAREAVGGRFTRVLDPWLAMVVLTALSGAASHPKMPTNIRDGVATVAFAIIDYVAGDDDEIRAALRAEMFPGAEVVEENIVPKAARRAPPAFSSN